MSLLDMITESIVAIFLIVVFFFVVFPSMSEIPGISPLIWIIIGILLISAVILNVFKR